MCVLKCHICVCNKIHMCICIGVMWWKVNVCFEIQMCICKHKSAFFIGVCVYKKRQLTMSPSPSPSSSPSPSPSPSSSGGWGGCCLQEVEPDPVSVHELQREQEELIHRPARRTPHCHLQQDWKCRVWHVLRDIPRDNDERIAEALSNVIASPVL